MKFEIVQMVDGETIVTRPLDIIAWANVAGVKITGYNTNKSQRIELQGQPKLAGFCGPMWNGNNTLRYEDTESYHQFST